MDVHSTNCIKRSPKEQRSLQVHAPSHDPHAQTPVQHWAILRFDLVAVDLYRVLSIMEFRRASLRPLRRNNPESTRKYIQIRGRDGIRDQFEVTGPLCVPLIAGNAVKFSRVKGVRQNAHDKPSQYRSSQFHRYT